MLNYELKLFRYLQSIDIVYEMKIISKPFNTNIILILLFILFITKIINSRDLKIILFGLIFNNILKQIFQRKRPYNESKAVGNLSNKKHTFLTNKYSFPSGHTFSSTLLTLILLFKYPHNITLNYFINLIPVLVGFSRIYLGVHYPSDILGGIIFAFLYFKVFY